MNLYAPLVRMTDRQQARCRRGGWSCGPACPDRKEREVLVPAFLRAGSSPLARLAKETMLK